MALFFRMTVEVFDSGDESLGVRHSFGHVSEQNAVFSRSQDLTGHFEHNYKLLVGPHHLVVRIHD